MKRFCSLLFIVLLLTGCESKIDESIVTLDSITVTFSDDGDIVSEVKITNEDPNRGIADILSNLSYLLDYTLELDGTSARYTSNGKFFEIVLLDDNIFDKPLSATGRLVVTDGDFIKGYIKVLNDNYSNKYTGDSFKSIKVKEGVFDICNLDGDIVATTYHLDDFDLTLSIEYLASCNYDKIDIVLVQ